MEPKINYIVIREEPGYHIGSYSEITEISVETDVITALEKAYELEEAKSALDDFYYFVEARYA